MRNTAVHFIFLFMMLVCLPVFFTGCSGKKKVTYIPLEKRVQQARQKVEPDNASVYLEKHFATWRGARYRNGGLSRKGIDCSGFTQVTYKSVFSLNLPRTVREQVKKGKKISRKSLKPGDLVFFKTGLRQKHVGIYLENDQFIHASRSKGVTKSNLRDSYWNKRYWQAKRLRSGA